MNHLTQIPLSPDNESDYETTNRNMTDLDPGYNCTTNNNVLSTKYYLENYFSDLIKSTDSFAERFSLMHLNIRCISENIDKLNNYIFTIAF